MRRGRRRAACAVVGSAEEYGRVDPADLPLPRTRRSGPSRRTGASRCGVVSGHCKPGSVRAWRRSGSPRSQPPVRVKQHVPAPGALAADRGRRARRHRCVSRLGALDPYGSDRRRDVVRAYRLLMQHGTPARSTGVYGVGVSVSDIVLRLSRGPDRCASRPTCAPATGRGAPVGWAIRRKLRAALGWSPELQRRRHPRRRPRRRWMPGAH